MDIQTINHLYNVRFKLAAVHYNENGMRDQAVNKDGQPQYNIVYPEFKKGGYIYSARSDTCNWLCI